MRKTRCNWILCCRCCIRRRWPDLQPHLDESGQKRNKSLTSHVSVVNSFKVEQEIYSAPDERLLFRQEVSPGGGQETCKSNENFDERIRSNIPLNFFTAQNQRNEQQFSHCSAKPKSTELRMLDLRRLITNRRKGKCAFTLIGPIIDHIHQCYRSEGNCGEKLTANSQARNPSFVVDAPTQGNDPSPEAIRSEPADLFPVNIWVDPVSNWHQHRDERRENEIYKNQIIN